MVWGHSIQFVFALIALRWELGNQIVQCLSSKVSTVQYSTVQIVQFLSSMVRTVQYSAVQYSTWSEQCSNSNYNCKLSNYVELDRYQLQTLPN